MDTRKERLLHEKDALSNIQSEQTRGITGFFYKMYIQDSQKFAFRFNGKKILDIGAGDGIILEGCGLDPIEMDIVFERCRRLQNKQKKIICGSGFEIPIKSDSLDCVLLIAVLEHASDPGKIINEVYRVLKDGGEAAICVPNDITMSIGRTLLLKFPPWYPGHISFITPRKLIKWLKGGFKIIKGYNLPFTKLNFCFSLYYFLQVQKIKKTHEIE